MGNCTSLPKEPEDSVSNKSDMDPSEELILETFYVQSLASASYLVGSRLSGDCILIDPRRDIEDYELMMEEENLRLTCIFLTHLHSDFVCGYAELANKYNVKVVCNEDNMTHPSIIYVQPDWELRLSKNFQMNVLYTPGHTPGSLSFVLENTSSTNPQPYAVFTGDTIVPGGVGCVDSSVINIEDHTQQEYYLSLLFQSFHEVILGTFKGKVQIYSAHGYGSHHLPPTPETCTWQSTIEDEIRSNHAAFLTDMNRFMQFVHLSTTSPTILSPHIVDVNRRGATGLDDCFDTIPKLQPDDFAVRLGIEFSPFQFPNPYRPPSMASLASQKSRRSQRCIQTPDPDDEASSPLTTDESSNDDDECDALLSHIKHEIGVEVASNIVLTEDESDETEDAPHLGPPPPSIRPTSAKQPPSLQNSEDMKCESEEDDGLLSSYGYTPEMIRGMSESDQLTIRKYCIPQQIILDTRSADAYATAHIPKSINIPVGESRGILLSQWEGRVELLLSNLVTQFSEILLIGDGNTREYECVLRLSRIGLDECVKAICFGGFNEWVKSEDQKPIEMTPRLHINTQNDWRSVLRSYRIFDLNASCEKIRLNGELSQNGTMSPVSASSSMRLSSSPMPFFSHNPSTPISVGQSHRKLTKVSSCPDLMDFDGFSTERCMSNNKMRSKKKIWRSVNNCPFLGNPYVWKVGRLMDKNDRYALCDSHDWNATVYASILRSCGVTVCDIAGIADWSEVSLRDLKERNNIGHAVSAPFSHSFTSRGLSGHNATMFRSVASASSVGISEHEWNHSNDLYPVPVFSNA